MRAFEAANLLTSINVLHQATTTVASDAGSHGKDTERAGANERAVALAESPETDAAKGSCTRALSYDEDAASGEVVTNFVP